MAETGASLSVSGDLCPSCLSLWLRLRYKHTQVAHTAFQSHSPTFQIDPILLALCVCPDSHRGASPSFKAIAILPLSHSALTLITQGGLGAQKLSTFTLHQNTNLTSPFSGNPPQQQHYHYLYHQNTSSLSSPSTGASIPERSCVARYHSSHKTARRERLSLPAKTSSLIASLE